MADDVTRTRTFSSWSGWSLRLEATARPPRCPVDDPDAAEVWRDGVKATVEELLGSWPSPPPRGPDVEIGEATELQGRNRDGTPVRIERRDLVFDSEASMSVPATLLVPEPARRNGAGILAIHGHGVGREAIVSTDPDPAAEREGFGWDLAQEGFVVLAPDLRGFGQRAEPLDEFGRHWCDINLVWAAMHASTPLTHNLWDLMRGLDVLGGLPEVDADRLGAVGFSYGATCTLFLAALDPRVRAAVVSGYFSSWASAHRIPMNMCGSQVMWGMLGRIEHGDVASLALPRSLFFESGRGDFLFPLEAATEEVAYLRSMAGVFGGRVEHRVHDAEHQWSGLGVADFLTDELAVH